MVKKYRYIIIYILLQLCFSKTNFLDVITTNDLHGFIDEQTAHFINPHYPPHIIGGSGFIKYVNEIKKETSDNLLILDGGNFFQGNPVGIIDSGRTIINWMNKVGYNAIVPGNNDFLFGVQNLIELSNNADFDFLASNLYFSNTEKLVFKAYEIYSFKGVRIGVLGMVNSNLNNIVLDKNIEGVMIVPPLEAMDKWIPEMKKNGAEIIIMLTSFGVPWDRDKVYNKFINSDKNEINNAIELGYYADDIDLIISGGISKGYPQPWYDPNSHVYTFQNYGNGTSFGHFKINFDELNGFIGFDYEVENSISQTLFLNDFSYDESAYKWIKNKFSFAIEEKYKPINWNLKLNKNTKNKSYRIENNWDVPTYDIEENLDIITWNCEFFPTANDSTINALSEIIIDLDVDIIAFQEIKNRGWFSKLINKIPEYGYIISEQSSFMDQAIIYRNDDFTFVSHLELFAEDDYNFAGRPPLQANFIHNESRTKFSIIDLHMKCCDSGLFRRQRAAEQLYNYLIAHIESNPNVIVLGDWNDDLKDKNGEHCFSLYQEDDSFIFPTEDITNIIDKASYPKEPYVSFLDHIMITEKFIKNKKYIVDTVPMDDYMGSFKTYEAYISDHMPVYLSFPY